MEKAGVPNSDDGCANPGLLPPDAEAAYSKYLDHHLSDHNSNFVAVEEPNLFSNHRLL